MPVGILPEHYWGNMKARIFAGEMPKKLIKEVEGAVREFVKESGTKGDPDKVFSTTIRTIAGYTVCKTGDFWVAEDDKGLVAYATGYQTIDIDDSLTYYLTQVWVKKEYRNKKMVKEWYSEIKKHAKEMGSKYFIALGNRKPEAYARFLGNNTEVYAYMLKQDL